MYATNEEYFNERKCDHCTDPSKCFAYKPYEYDASMIVLDILCSDVKRLEDTLTELGEQD